MGGGIRNVIAQLNRRWEVGSGNIAAEIMRGEWVAPLITDITNSGKYNNKANNEWIQGIATLLSRSKDPLKLGNYRFITLLNMI